MLKLDIKIGETVEMAGGARMTLEQKSGGVARFAVDAPQFMRVRLIRAGEAASEQACANTSEQV